MLSVLHATYGRPQKAVAAMRMWMERASLPSTLEYIFAANSDDPAFAELAHRVAEERKQLPNVHLITGEFAGSVAAWDAAAKACHGDLLIQGQDDVEPPRAWDTMLPLFVEAPMFVAVSDGYRKTVLCTTAIMNRAFYEMEGCFLFPGFLSVFSDDDVTIRALKAARDRRATFVNARHLVFLHRHHYHDKTVPLDATYLRENSPEAYLLGQHLFATRNAEALNLGLKTW